MDVTIMEIHNGMAFVQNVTKIFKHKDEWMPLPSMHLLDFEISIIYLIILHLVILETQTLVIFSMVLKKKLSQQNA